MDDEGSDLTVKESKVKPTEEVAPNTLNTNKTNTKDDITLKELRERVNKTNRANDSTSKS